MFVIGILQEGRGRPIVKTASVSCPNEKKSVFLHF